MFVKYPTCNTFLSFYLFLNPLWLQGLWDDDRGCQKRPGDGAGVWLTERGNPNFFLTGKQLHLAGRDVWIYIFYIWSVLLTLEELEKVLLFLVEGSCYMALSMDGIWKQ